MMLLIKGIYIYNLSIHEDPGLKASQSNLENGRKLNMQRERRKEERQEEEEEEGVGGLEKEQLGQLWLLLYTAWLLRVEVSVVDRVKVLLSLPTESSERAFRMMLGRDLRSRPWKPWPAMT